MGRWVGQGRFGGGTPGRPLGHSDIVILSHVGSIIWLNTPERTYTLQPVSRVQSRQPIGLDRVDVRSGLRGDGKNRSSMWTNRLTHLS